MKKIRKILAVMLVLVMSMALVAGCSNKSKQTMFSIIKDANSMTHYSYNVDMKLESSISGLENLALTFTGKTDGEAMTMGAKVSYSFITMDVDDFITLTKDAVYVDVQTIFEKLAPLLLGSSYSLEDFENEFGVELKCIRIPFVDGMVNLNGGSEELADTYISVLESAFKDVKITEDKGVFTAKIEGLEEFSKLADAFITALLDKQDAIMAELDKNSVDEAKLKEFVDLYTEEIIKVLEKFNEDYDAGLTEDDFNDLRDQAEAAFNDAMAEVNLDDVDSTYKETFDELRDNKDELVKEIAEIEDTTADMTITSSLTGKEGSRVYNCTGDINAENTNTDEDIQLNINSVMTEDNNISVKAPESYTELSDIIYAALVFAYENGLLDDIADGIYDVY